MKVLVQAGPVVHDGKTYQDEDFIEGLSEEQAEALRTAGVAAPVIEDVKKSSKKD